MSKVILLLSFTFLFSLSSCGLRTDEDLFSNPIKGSWKLEQINCYATSDPNRDNALEIYNIPTEHLITLDLDIKTFEYIVVGNNGCIPRANGSYSISFNSSIAGKIDISDLVGASSACSIPIVDSKGGINANVPFVQRGDTIYTKDLEWEIENSKLILESTTAFRGSNTGGLFCSDNCNCFNTYISN